jgi:hypothetical protein
MAARELVAAERRQGERRSSHLHLAPDPDPRGELLNRSERAHVEIDLIEVQCAVEAALDRASHSIAAQKLIDNELRALRAALKSALDASRSATRTVSGVAS